jgi:hypothetical protein
MSLYLDQLLLLGLISSAVHWIIARSEIARPFWSLDWWSWSSSLSRCATYNRHVRDWFWKLLVCPACSGFWIGLGLGFAGVQPVRAGWFSILATALLCVVVTPIFEAILLWGLERTRID